MFFLIFREYASERILKIGQYLATEVVHKSMLLTFLVHHHQHHIRFLSIDYDNICHMFIRFRPYTIHMRIRLHVKAETPLNSIWCLARHHHHHLLLKQHRYNATHRDITK